MDTKKDQPFRFRRFFSLITALSFMLAALSGLILYLRPEGSLARWVGWQVLGLDKKQWEELHTVMVFVFVIVAFIHLIFNSKSLIQYMKAAPFFLRRINVEIGYALGVVVLFFVLSIYNLPPASWIFQGRELFKDGEAVLKVSPPVPDADKRTVSELCSHNRLTIEQFDKRVKELKLTFDTRKNWGQNAKLNKVSAQDLYIKVFGPNHIGTP